MKPPLPKPSSPPRAKPSAKESDISESGQRAGALLLGRVLDGRFLVERVLGEGGMGYVYGGRDRQSGQKVAIKVMRSETMQNPEIVQRFYNEAEAASQIGSPHICSVFGFGHAPSGAAYFVMEYLDGYSLSQVLTKDGVLSPYRGLRIARQMAIGLSATHRRGIIHRDLKPDNIMLVSGAEGEEFVKILDFGVAKMLHQRSKLTRAGTVFGTPQYMAPEQAAGSSDIDPRADIYSLGIILYELLAGDVPFDDDNIMNVLSHQMFREPPSIHERAPQPIPAEVAALIGKCLQKDPKHRYGSMLELITDIDRARQGVKATSLHSTPPPASKAAKAAESSSEKSSPLLTGMVGIFIFLCVIIFLSTLHKTLSRPSVEEELPAANLPTDTSPSTTTPAASAGGPPTPTSNCRSRARDGTCLSVEP